MTDFAFPIVFASLVWFVSTGAILWLVAAPRRTHFATMIGASFLLGSAMVGLSAIADDASVLSAVIGFTLGVVVWGWHETGFLLGYVTGWRTSDCPPGLKAWRRFVAASETVMIHELAIAANAILLVAMTWNAPNQVGLFTFLLLWGMRLSAKANVFLGAPSLNEDFLPAHLAYLRSYFGPRRVNGFFPVSIAAVTLAAGLLIAEAASAPARSFEAMGFGLVATLATLAVIEHLFMVLPWRDAVLWDWARRAAAPAPGMPATTTTLKDQPAQLRQNRAGAI